MASNMGPVRTAKEESNICSICLEILTQPVALPCVHMFCRQCITGYIKQLKEIDISNGFNCPFCRKCILLPQKEGSNINMVLDNIEEKAALMKVKIDENESSSNDRELCGPCGRERLEVTAAWYCFDCDENICQECTTHHKKNKASYKHVIKDVAELKSSNHDSKNLDVIKQLNKCQNHPLEIVKFVCIDHDKLCCSDCFVYEHRNCIQVVSIAKIVSMNKNDETDEKYQKRLASLEAHARFLHRREHDQMATIDISKERVEERVAELKKHFEKICDEIVKHKIGESTILHQQLSKSIAKRMKDIEHFTNGITELREFQDAATMHGNETIVYLAGRKLERDIRQYESAIRDIHGLTKSESIEIREQDLISDLSELLKTFISVVKTSQQAELPACPFRYAVMSSEFCCKRTKDTKSYVRGCVFVEDDLVVIDCNVCELKVFEIETQTIRSTHTFVSQPWTITKFENTQVAVGLPMEHKICIMEIKESKLVPKNVIVTAQPIWGLAYSEKENALIAMSRDNGSLNVVKVDGTPIRSIQLDKQTTSAVKKAYCISLDKNTEVCYVSSHGLNKVIAINLDGHVLFSYKHPDLKSPWGVEFDSEQNAYICSAGSDAIHKLDNTGKFLCKILTPVDGLVKPFSLCFHKAMDKLAVTANHVDKEIKIYDVYKTGIYL